ncbi:5'-methylthioadenosine/S-adenosylhomocysteine nucleosidase [Bdellovibrio reynosensis]|uniref:5'-methylthioadenosine/S-adenosylhomocysteine nucleosidase n=2 Tax=Bdellovibrio reynosensis TaxID=2835041 RepID=A0ABY4CDD3_9BACT|nr:5'-methylthioadenosine/S-adenosylhomocysteine nucleosidase [Bdellovibrio reynosensis]UOF02952.1 5'-methylthioadenosine/S-adenosylhomocysteine nucleosidase [Bdellovibrio reynosensis]
MFNTNDIALLMALPGESQGLFEKENINVHYTGIGKVNAAMVAMDVIQKTKCKVIINLGTAGSSKFPTHDLVEVSTFVQRDMDISPLGFKVGETPFDPIPGAIELIPFFPELSQGVCGTGDSFETGTPKVPCELVDMEGYALAKVCRKMGVQLVSLKYITDGADHNAHNDWEANLVLGAKKLLEYYKKMVK